MIGLFSWESFSRGRASVLRLLGVLTCAATMGMTLRAEESTITPGNDFEANIQRVFEGDQVADIRVTFGYDNWTDFKDPNDPGRARSLMTYLAGHGFHQIPCTEDLAKELGVPPDARNLRILEGSGQPGQKLRIALICSAATANTATNIGAGYSRQLRCSNEALKFMQKAASDADVMIYVGHSRDGGGPDTFPPQTIPGAVGDRQRVDFGYYRNEKPGLAALREHFSKTSGKPHIIVWTGCMSDRFSGWLSDRLAGKKQPASAVLSTRLTRQMPWAEGIEGVDEGLMVVTRLIEALQQHHTKAWFEKSLLACELEDMREPSRPEWRLLSIPPHDQQGAESGGRRHK